MLASAGANDGTVKLWDLRKTFYNVRISFIFGLTYLIFRAPKLVAGIDLQSGLPASTKSFLSRQVIYNY